ncbi:MAG: monovalent cation:proton antiporter-2 (CPA2) family protein [Chromatiaceae bacterium]|nr:monovalent cation:proton antiporter-2 (CPA2) family protein [Chromatiaceae bacterium]
MAEPHDIADILVLLTAGIVAVLLFQRVGLGTVLGFLVAGALVGPWGLGFIVAVDEIRHLAEFGVVFLLFIIGIELKPSRLWVMRRSVFGLGTAQVLATGAVIALIALALGLPARTALITGFGLALSSTAFGLQILQDKGELGTAYGRSAFAVLLLQDLAIVPLIALLPLLARPELGITEDVELAGLEAVLIFVGVFVLGRVLLRPILQLVAESRRNPEIFTATGILLVLGAAWLTDWAGLSMALGAFLGGLLLADSRYRHQIVADIQPFRGLLLGLFFMSVGMSVNFGLLARQGIQVAGLVGGLLLLKAALLWALCRITGRSHTESTQVSLLLAQAGEFGFVLFGLAHILGLMDGELYQLLLLVIALSMAATPLLVRSGRWLGSAPASSPPAAAPPVAGSQGEPIPALRNHVIVAGCGRFGNALAHILAKAGVPYLVLELDPIRVARARALSYPVFYGDASRTEVLRSAGAADAAMVVLALDQMESIGKAVVRVREIFPDLPIFARAWDVGSAQRLRAMGVTCAIPETMASGLQLAGDVLRASGISPEEAVRLIDEVRDEKQRKIARPPKQDRQMGFKDILLVLTPGIDETAALEHAAVLAEDNRAALTVVEVLSEVTADVERDEQGVSSPDELDEEMAASRRRRLEDLVSHLRGRLEVQTKLLFGRPHEAITREVVSNERDLVLKAAEGGRGLRERLFGDKDTRLLKTCPCPVLLVRSIPPRPNRYRRILAGVYLGENPASQRDERDTVNHKIVEHAASLAITEFAELHVVHVWEAYGEQDLRSPRSPYQWDADAYVESQQKRNQEALNACLAKVRDSLASKMLAAFNPVCHLVKGGRREELLRLATSLEADLVVVGSAGRSGITALIVESTAETLAKGLDCSVLVVKPPGFVTPVVVEEP